MQIYTTHCCILSKFYIKPQRNRRYFDKKNRCILSKFYIKPQLTRLSVYSLIGCILSKFYIKPQHLGLGSCGLRVVSYRNSTSNHNTLLNDITKQIVVSYRNSTSNHNEIAGREPHHRLYLIEILHQTTTAFRYRYSESCCILSKFYIKPQLLLVY